MRILVVGHRLELGGSQTNTVQLAATLARRGHELTLAAAPGPARALVEAAGLPLVELPDTPRHPSRPVAARLEELVADLQPDLVHAWEWPQVLDAFWGPHRRRGAPLLATSMSMVVLRTLPRHVPLTVGTEALLDATRRTRPGPVHLLEPPVDVAADDPGVVDGAAFARAAGLEPGAARIVVVSRLAEPIKVAGIEHAIDVVAALGARRPLQLVVVGDGPDRGRLEARAEAANRYAGRPVVCFTGAVADPRAAYAAADVVLANGSSSLRGMAFARPTIVYGADRFTEVVGPQTVARFLWDGFYGIGDGADRLAAQLEALLDDPGQRVSLGSWCRRFVTGRYGLDGVADRLEGIYRETLGTPVPSRPVRELDAAVLRARSVAGALRDRARHAVASPDATTTIMSGSTGTRKRTRVKNSATTSAYPK